MENKNECCEGNHRFKSIGQIQVRMRKKDKDNHERHIYFTPNSDYSAKHEGKSYALFFPNGGNETYCISRQLPDTGGGVEILYPISFPDLVGAAISQSSVEVEVEVHREEKIGPAILRLFGIRIPADGKIR